MRVRASRQGSWTILAASLAFTISRMIFLSCAAVALLVWKLLMNIGACVIGFWIGYTWVRRNR